jgi:hypothetical protein
MNLQRRRSQEDEEPSTIAQDGETVHATLMFMDAQQREVQSRYQDEGSGDDERGARLSKHELIAWPGLRTLGKGNPVHSLSCETRRSSPPPRDQNQLRGEPGIPPKTKTRPRSLARRAGLVKKRHGEIPHWDMRSAAFDASSDIDTPAILL